MKTLFITCVTIFVVLHLALVVNRFLAKKYLVVNRFLAKKYNDVDLMTIISISVKLLQILDCVALLLGTLYISGETTAFWLILINWVAFILNFLFQTYSELFAPDL